jgi:two-component system phosphate regulon sensor histidine kinase PhoR
MERPVPEPAGPGGLAGRLIRDVLRWLGVGPAGARLAPTRAALAAIAAFAVLLIFRAITLGPAVAGIGLAIAADLLFGRWLQRSPAVGRAVRPIAAQAAADAGWQSLIDGMADAVIVLAADATISHHNAAAAELLARIRTSIPFSQVSRAPELLEAIDAVMRTGIATTVTTHERVPVDRRLSVRLARLGPAGWTGEPYVLLTFRDLTEQDRLDQMRSDFVANASHELRTPLAALRGFVETLQGPAKDDAGARARFLAIMSAQAERMTRLIDDLLSLSRAEMREHVPPKGRVDLYEVARFVARELEPVAKVAAASISIVSSPALAMVRGDRDELVQVLQNLVQNAIKYGRSGGQVTVRLATVMADQRRQVSVEVADDGPGIAPEHLPRLTERFYRVDAATSRETGGTGLGLAIVKHTLARHGSELRIESRLGKGSSFEFRLDAVHE